MKQFKLVVLGMAIGIIFTVGYGNNVLDEAGQVKAAHAAFAKS